VEGEEGETGGMKGSKRRKKRKKERNKGRGYAMLCYDGMKLNGNGIEMGRKTDNLSTWGF